MQQQQDAKDKFFGELGELLGNHRKGKSIEQSISFDKLKHMNISCLVNVIENNIISKPSLKTKLVHLSYDKMLSSINRSIPIKIENIIETYNGIRRHNDIEDEVIHVCSSIYKISSKILLEILYKREYSIPFVVRNNISFRDFFGFALNINTVRINNTHFNTLINSLISSSYFHPTLSLDDIILVENRILVDEEIETKMGVIFTGVPIKINKEDKSSAHLYMKFQIFSMLGIYEELTETFMLSMNKIEDLANKSHIKPHLDNLYLKKLEKKKVGPYDGDDIWSLYYTEDSRMSSRIISSRVKSEEFMENVKRIGTSGWVLMSDPNVFMLDFNPVFEDISLIDAMSNNVLETVYIIIKEKYEEYSENISNVVIGNSLLTLNTQHETIGVFLNTDATQVLINGVHFTAEAGSFAILSKGNNVVKIEDGYYIWFY